MSAEYPMRFSPRENRAGSIGWREWGEGAFREAERDGKLILLSISASWCHWCHVMDETTYSDPDVIELIRRHCVPVRVDTDLQPEINRRYNQGGWPTTAFLDPEGRLLAGATYIPPETMAKALERIYVLYQENRDNLDWSVAPFEEREPVNDLRRESLKIAALALSLWDRVHGGLGNAPKFPLPETILLSFDAYLLTGNEDFLRFSLHTLQSMVNSRIFDRVEGGFFRYSVTADWSEPHYEKLLEENALILLALHHATSTGMDEHLEEALEMTAGYITTTLYGGGGIFFPSQDALEDYYRLGAGERKRAQRPAVDPIPLSRPAATASRALLRLGAGRGRGEWVRIALEALEQIASTFSRDGGIAHAYGEYRLGEGHLEDQTATFLALLDAYSLTGEEKYLHVAYEILDLLVEEYRLGDTGLLADVAEKYLPPKLHLAPASPEALGEAAIAMTWRWVISGEERWREEAHSLLSHAFSHYSNVGVHASPLAWAGLLLTEKPLLVKLAPGKEYGTYSGRFLSFPLSHIRPVPHEPEGGEPPFQICGPDSCLAASDDVEQLFGSLRGLVVPGRDGDQEVQFT
ncbi:MAG: DUF255 domain-containing protein [Candidatus Geothermincolales bacterium]